MVKRRRLRSLRVRIRRRLRLWQKICSPRQKLVMKSEQRKLRELKLKVKVPLQLIVIPLKLTQALALKRKRVMHK